MKGYAMSVDVAMRFFKECAEKHLDTLEERLKLMNELIHEENIRIMNEKQIKEAIKNKKLLRIKPHDELSQ